MSLNLAAEDLGNWQHARIDWTPAGQIGACQHQDSTTTMAPSGNKKHPTQVPGFGFESSELIKSAFGGTISTEHLLRGTFSWRFRELVPRLSACLHPHA